MVTKQENDRASTSGRIHGFEVYEPGGGTQGPKNCGRHDMGRRRGGKGQMAEVMR
jgi:hypothetical protein